VAPPPVDIAAEEAAIKAVLKLQTQAWSEKSLDGEAAVWAQEPYVFRGYPIDSVVGWEALEGFYQEQFETGSWPPFTAEMSDHHIRIAGDTAWAVYHQVSKRTNEQGEEESDTSWEIRILEKKSGQWRLVLQMTGPYPDWMEQG
jgi:ketosteroid isomerase-like protein